MDQSNVCNMKPAQFDFVMPAASMDTFLFFDTILGDLKLTG